MPKPSHLKLLLQAPAAVEPPLDARPDDELMLLTSAGHREAFEALLRRHLPRLSRYCAKFSGDASAGEELAQEVMVQVWTASRRYQPQGRFVTYLFTLARNRCRNLGRDHRRRGAWVELHQNDALEVAHSGPHRLDVLLAEEFHRRVREVLRSLPEKLREAVLLRFDQELSYAEISEVVGCPEPTARTRVFNAIKQLRAQLDGGHTQ